MTRSGRRSLSWPAVPQPMSHPRSPTAARASATRDDLPMPGSPSIQTTAPSPRRRPSMAERTAASSCWRPTHCGGRSIGHMVVTYAGCRPRPWQVTVEFGWWAGCGGSRDRLCGLGPMLAGEPRGGGDGKVADPAHPFGGFLGVIAELLRHPVGAALSAKPEQGAADRLFHAAGARSLRLLQPGGEQRLASYVIYSRPGHYGSLMLAVKDRSRRPRRTATAATGPAGRRSTPCLPWPSARVERRGP